MVKTKKMIEEIIKNAEYEHPKNEALHGAWFEGNYQFVTDAYRAICIYNPVDVKERESQFTLTVTDKFIDAELNCTETIALPSTKEIREQIRNLIGRKYRSYRVFYRLNNNPKLASVNAKYLVECMEAIGATELKYNPNRPQTGILLMETELGKAILLPVHNKTETAEYWVREIREMQ